ncbi:MAG: methylmalonyl Co-A mutase-associated GTPase MeaB [Hyphomicrobiaceae bacterium]
MARLVAGERRAIAQAITELERDGSSAPALLAAMQPHLGRALVIGVTGPPGAGKSTLVDAFTRHVRNAGRSVGILAVDPSSPVSGGSILGDRIRMSSARDDDLVFMRSLASGGHLGGLSPAAVRAIDVLDAAGKELVILETVGTGQSEIDIAEIADVRVVLAAPGLGDDIQAMKSGLLEIADVLVVNKADREGADETVRHLVGAMATRSGASAGTPVAVLATVALTGKGIPALASEIDRIAESRIAVPPRERRRRRARYILARATAELITRRLKSGKGAELEAVCDGLLGGTIGLGEAARRLLDG